VVYLNHQTIPPTQAPLSGVADPIFRAQPPTVVACAAKNAGAKSRVDACHPEKGALPFVPLAASCRIPFGFLDQTLGNAPFFEGVVAIWYLSIR
jgi:hypothetical protein